MLQELRYCFIMRTSTSFSAEISALVHRELLEVKICGLFTSLSPVCKTVPGMR